MKEVNNHELELKSLVGHVTWVKIESHFDKIIKAEKDVITVRHKKKLMDLNIAVDDTVFKNKLVYNFSYRALTPAEHTLLSKGWRYAINVKKLNSMNVKADLEYLFYCLDRNSLITSNNLTKVKYLLAEFCNKLNNRIESEIPNLSCDEIKAMNTLMNDHTLVITKVDKGNAIAVLNRIDYLDKANAILDDKNLFVLRNRNLTEEREKELIHYLLKLKRGKIITEKQYDLMRPKTGSRTPYVCLFPYVAYFLPKVHKSTLPVRPIISSYDAYNHNTARYLANLLLSSISESDSYLKDSFEFVHRIKQNKSQPGLIFSLDVASLFTNVPLELAITIAIEKIRKYHPSLTIDDNNLRQLFYYCTKRTNFTFDNRNYDQINGVAMGSPLAPILGHLFMTNLELKLKEFRGKKPDIYLRYVDDIFVLLHGTQKDAAALKKYMNSLHPTIKFSIEVQNDNKLPFLDVMVERKDKELITYVYRKPTDTGLYLKWTSNQPRSYKINLLKCLCIRAQRICSTSTLLEQQFQYFRIMFRANGYPNNVINKVIRGVKL
ncbi:unnamed protein product, partial [Didymodactylos carnosus]